MRFLHKVAAGMMVVGLLVLMAGGMSIRRGPDGTWVQFNLVHAVGGVSLLGGVALAILLSLRVDSRKVVTPPLQ